ncbi:MAG: hypothetical protein ACYCZY_08580 [Lacisediminihabitans sp.]
MSAFIEARARSVLSSAMNSAMRMMVINTTPASGSPPTTATRVATVTKISVPILRMRMSSIKPVLASGYNPMATAPHKIATGTNCCQNSTEMMPVKTIRATSIQRCRVISDGSVRAGDCCALWLFGLL